MDKYNRRKFIITSGGALAAAMTPDLNFLNQDWRNPSDTITVGLIGCRNMGYWLMYHALNQPGVACGGLCDVDQTVLVNRAKDFEKQTGSTPTLYSDYRKMLEDKAIDAVIIEKKKSLFIQP